MSKQLAVTLAVSLLGGVIFSSTVVGAFNEIHHGTLCKPKSTADAAIIGYDNFGIHNRSETQTAFISCGSLLSEDRRDFGVRGVAFDRHPSQEVCCTAVWQDKNTGDSIAVAQDCSEGFGSDDQTLIMDMPSTIVAIASMECSIPPKTVNGFSHVSSWVL